MEYFTSKLKNKYNIDIDVIEIKNSNNYKIKFYSLGGYINEIHIPYLNDISTHEDVILGYDKLDDILEGQDYFNFIIGRVCNRISNSQFTLNKRNYKLYSNDNNHCIHGGKKGFSNKIWKINEIKKKENFIRCTMNYYSKDMEENFPGNLECTTTYELNNKNEFKIIYQAKTDQDTIVNMTNHNYWNFHGHKSEYQNIIDHYVKINSEFICENNDQAIPTGKLLNVKNTKYDLNKYYLIDEKFLESGGIDNNYCLKNNNINKPVAKIYSRKTGMGVEYYTDQPGIQFYTGNMMKKKYSGKYNKYYGIQYGLCLETQQFPDAINKSNFPSPILKKGDIYKSYTKIKLRNDFI